ncbi:DnaX DNA polymerase III, gamma/tau subunits [Fimbriimonadaceae bacterium]
MSTVSLYRKYRSQTFNDLIGQDHVIRTLQNGITSGRISHAYLFTGPRGTGKTSTARLLAKALCATDGPTPNPSDDDPICKSIAEGSCVDVVELDAASESGVDSVREKIVEVAEYRPMIARYRIFIIDEVHDLSRSAFDALLKTIEEPPAHLVFILATTEFNKVPPTIRSRCQKYEFHRASMADLVSRLSYVAEQEGISIEPGAVTAIARMADGGYRDALTLLEQAIVATNGKITLQAVYDQLGLVPEESTDRLLLAIKANDVVGVIKLVEDMTRAGRDPRAILESALYRLSDLTRASYQIDRDPDATREASMHDVSVQLGRDSLLWLRSSFAEAHKVIRDISLPRLWLESELVRLAQHAGAAPVAVVAAASAPAPAVTKPAAKPVEVAPAAQAAPVVQEPAAEVEVASAPVVPADLSSAEGLLAELLRVLPEVAHKKKLNGVSAITIEGENLVLEHPRKFDVDWFKENAKREGYINDQLTKLVGSPMRVEFRVGKRNHSSQDVNSTVELPYEGDKLAQLVRETFQTDTPEAKP